MRFRDPVKMDELGPPRVAAWTDYPRGQRMRRPYSGDPRFCGHSHVSLCQKRGRMLIPAEQQGYGLSLELVSRKPPVLNGHNGLAVHPTIILSLRFGPKAPLPAWSSAPIRSFNKLQSYETDCEMI